MLTLPVTDLLGYWLVTLAAVGLLIGFAVGYKAYDKGEADAQAECKRRHPGPPAAAAAERVISLADWQARTGRPAATEPIPMWVLDAAMGIVEAEQRAADPLAGLDTAGARTEREIRRLSDAAMAAIGPTGRNQP